MRRNLTIIIAAVAFFSLSSCCCTNREQNEEVKVMVDTGSERPGAPAPVATRR